MPVARSRFAVIFFTLVVQGLSLPLLIITSEFGTLSMWDWELITYLKSEGAGAGIIAPYTLELTRVALRKGSLVVNSSQGGGTKDTWVMT